MINYFEKDYNKLVNSLTKIIKNRDLSYELLHDFIIYMSNREDKLIELHEKNQLFKYTLSAICKGYFHSEKNKNNSQYYRKYKKSKSIEVIQDEYLDESNANYIDKNEIYEKISYTDYFNVDDLIIFLNSLHNKTPLKSIEIDIFIEYLLLGTYDKVYQKYKLNNKIFISTSSIHTYVVNVKNYLFENRKEILKKLKK